MGKTFTLNRQTNKGSLAIKFVVKALAVQTAKAVTTNGKSKVDFGRTLGVQWPPAPPNRTSLQNCARNVSHLLVWNEVGIIQTGLLLAAWPTSRRSER